MAKKLSISIEDNEIILMLSNRDRIEKWANIMLEPDLVSDGVIQDEAKVATIIQNHLKLFKINESKAIFSLSGLNCLFRVISLPMLPDAVVSEAVYREAERILPVPIDSLYLSFQVLSQVENEIKIFIAAYPKEATDSLVSTSRRAGLEPYLLDLAPLAICRSVTIPRAVVVNTNASRLDIIIMLEQVPHVIRNLSMTGSTDNSMERLGTIAEEIDRTITFFNSDQGKDLVDDSVPILTSGDLAIDSQGMELLASRMGHPVSAMIPPMILPENFIDAHNFMVNIGLVLKELSNEKQVPEYSKINFNALPDKYMPKHISPLSILIPVVGLVGAAGIIFLGYQVMNIQSHIEALNSELIGIQQQTTNTRNSIPALEEEVDHLATIIEPLEYQIDEINIKLDTLATTRTIADEHTTLIVDSLPDSTNLTMIDITPDMISVEGEVLVDDYDKIFEYTRTLRSTYRYLDVVISEVKLFEESITPAETEEDEEDEEIEAETIEKYVFKLSLFLKGIN
jgi:type IV pilus assembly protein PilM